MGLMPGTGGVDASWVAPGSSWKNSRGALARTWGVRVSVASLERAGPCYLFTSSIGEQRL